VDDTDGLDEQAEFEAWKLRELQRIKRDTEALYAYVPLFFIFTYIGYSLRPNSREREREEVLKRREMPEALRLKEDLERAKKSREERPRGQQAFLQKYYHKGAFYQVRSVCARVANLHAPGQKLIRIGHTFRTTTFSNAITLRRPRMRSGMLPHYQRSCKFAISERPAGPSTPTWPTRSALFTFSPLLYFKNLF
jgi:hypothetical protein